MSRIFDIAIVGGGINGVGIARDAAGRGLSVFLAEQNDLASGTSSAATKLIHGGLRYLEQYEFSLVRESLKEREVLWKIAPHIIWPLRFIAPHNRELRPAFMIRIGLFLYDHLGGRKLLPASNSLNLLKDEAGQPLKSDFRLGFEYSDCWVDDARLVVLNAVDARERGADIRVRTEVVRAVKENGHWKLDLKDRGTGETSTVRARILINAAGPWVANFLNGALQSNTRAAVRLVKGSHIVVRKLFEHGKAYIFQNADRRVIFAIPYENDYTLIGTTDVEYEGDPADVKISPDEIDYLCNAASEYFSHPVTSEDVVWTYSGVRPLYDDGDADPQEVTRDFVLELDAGKGEPVLLNIFGGKLTTYRYLAEKALGKLKPWLTGAGPEWTRTASLPGGDFAVDGFDRLVWSLQKEHKGFPPSLVRRLARSYGTKVREILGDTASPEELGIHFGGGLYQKEVEYLVDREWARTADDILWRRSKLGLKLGQVEKKRLNDWLDKNNL